MTWLSCSGVCALTFCSNFSVICGSHTANLGALSSEPLGAIRGVSFSLIWNVSDQSTLPVITALPCSFHTKPLSGSSAKKASAQQRRGGRWKREWSCAGRHVRWVWWMKMKGPRVGEEKQNACILFPRHCGVKCCCCLVWVQLSGIKKMAEVANPWLLIESSGLALGNPRLPFLFSFLKYQVTAESGFWTDIRSYVLVWDPWWDLWLNRWRFPLGTWNVLRVITGPFFNTRPSASTFIATGFQSEVKSKRWCFRSPGRG